MGSLFKQKFWLVGVPQIIAALMIGASIALYFHNYKQHAFIILIVTAVWSNVWWGFFYNRLVTSPIRKLLHTFSKGLVTIPELQGNLVARNDLSTISSDLEAVFRYLDESLTLYRQAINSAAEAILTIDEFGIIQSFNNSATRIFGYEPEEVLGKNISMLMPSPHREKHDKYLQTYMQTRETHIIGKGRELEAKRKDGSQFPIYLSVNHLKGGPTGNIFFGVIVDLTLPKKREHELIEARDSAEAANQSKDTFVANVSHELRTPLNAILGFSDMMHLTPLTEKQNEYLSYISSSGKSLLNIVNELLSLSAASHGALKVVRHSFNFNKLIKDCCASFELEAKNKGLDFTIDVAETIPHHFMGDSNKLRQIIANLLNNALRFTSKGYIWVNAMPVQSVSVSANNILLKITVEDTGIGVPMDKREIIFERFTQADSSLSRKYGGTGLGLAICRELLDLVNGKIYYEDNHPAGSRFVVLIPLEVTNVIEFDESTNRHESQDWKLDNRTNVLIVEDDFSNMALIREFLSHTNCKLYTAANGQEALELIATEKMDLILMDISMPVMEGIETISNIRQRHMTDNLGRPVFVAAMTANAMNNDEKKYLEFGFDEYIPKPVSFKTVESLMEKFATTARNYSNLN